MLIIKKSLIEIEKFYSIYKSPFKYSFSNR